MTRPSRSGQFNSMLEAENFVCTSIVIRFNQQIDDDDDDGGHLWYIWTGIVGAGRSSVDWQGAGRYDRDWPLLVATTPIA